MSNPILNDKTFANAESFGMPMTIQGTIGKTLFLTLIMLFCSCFTWNMFSTGYLDKANMFFTIGLIVSFVSVFLAGWKIQLSNIFSIIYAIGEGLCLGALSAMYAKFFDGIVIQAVFATVITLCVMLVMYLTGIIKATEKFKKVIFTATLAISIFYLIVLLASMFNISFLAPFMNAYDNIFVIGVIIVIAALNLITDFDMIEKGSEYGAPAYMEWYCGMALLITLVWLYIEFLKLLSRARK